MARETVARRGPERFRKRELTRALLATKAAGISARIDINTDGSLSIVPIGASEAAPEPNEWDKALGNASA